MPSSSSTLTACHVENALRAWLHGKLYSFHPAVCDLTKKKDEGTREKEREGGRIKKKKKAEKNIEKSRIPFVDRRSKKRKREKKREIYILFSFERRGKEKKK